MVLKLLRGLAYFSTFTATLLVLVSLVYKQPFLSSHLRSQQGSVQSALAGNQTDIEYIYELIRLHNIEREKRGLPPLKVSYELQRSALLKAYDIIVYSYWAHNNPKVTEHTPWFFIKDSIGDYAKAGENLARGFDNPKQLITAWLNSASHRKNILDPSFEYIGVARVHNQYNDSFPEVTVVHFAKTPTNKQLIYSAPNPKTQAPDLWVFTPVLGLPLPGNSIPTSGVSRVGVKAILTVSNDTLGSSTIIKEYPHAGTFALTLQTSATPKQATLTLYSGSNKLSLPLLMGDRAESTTTTSADTPLIVLTPTKMVITSASNTPSNTYLALNPQSNQYILGVQTPNTDNTQQTPPSNRADTNTNKLKIILLTPQTWLYISMAAWTSVFLTTLIALKKTKFRGGHFDTSIPLEAGLGITYVIVLTIVFTTGAGVV